MMQVRVKLFALVRDLAGTEEAMLQLAQGGTALQALAVLVEQYPELKPWKDHLRIAVNNDYVSGEEVLNESDEIAVIPPVSGG